MLFRPQQRRIPPGPSGAPIVGNLLAFTEDPLAFLSSCARLYGDVVRLSPANYLLAHPADVYSVMQDREGIFTKQPPGRRSGGFPGAMMNSEGEIWRRKRQWVQLAFSRERTHAWAPAIVGAAAAFADGLHEGERRDTLADMLELTLAIIGLVMFSSSVDEVHTVAAAVEGIMERTRSPIRVPRWWPGGANRRFHQSLRNFHALLDRLIQQRQDDTARYQDVLAHLLRESDSYRPGRDELRDEVATLLLSGHETTADALGWIWYALALHPEAAERLEGELAAVLGDRPVTVEDLPRLRYTEAVVKEAVRLFPPAWTTSREASRDTTIGGYPVAAGTQIGLSAWVLHRDPRWYAEPTVFRPERWLDGSLRALPRGAYIPFGAGPRVCIGAGLAQTEMMLILATVARRARLTLAPGQEVQPFPALTLRPQGLEMIVQKPVSASLRCPTGYA
ncbi:MAG TPA: cytochrome P450 [Roseiflexaceae bacterium]|nr:cytochrome P450 [Roseiflexaceae bacterium]